MRRRVLLVLAVLCLMVWAAALFVIQSHSAQRVTVIPTLMVLPSLTPTDTPLSTPVPTETGTSLPGVTPTSPYTKPPTVTPTLSERVLQISLAMPGVTIEPTPSPFPRGVQVIPAPPNPVEPLPDATNTAPPFTGWYSFESDYPSVRYEPPWTPRLAQAASRGQYHRTEMLGGSAFFPFEGEGLRVRYVAAQNMGIFEIVVDGVIIDTIDAFADTLIFPGTNVYFVGGGSHLLEIRATGRKNNLSEGSVVGLDAVQVFRGDANTLILPPQSDTSTPAPELQDALRIVLVSGPSTVQPTSSPVPPRVLTAAVVIAYDENGNRTVDPAEGVAGISVRVVEVHTNRVVASGFTDVRGYVAFELVTDEPARVVVPYFGETWDLQRGSTNATSVYTLLLTPGNQPGLIP